MICRLNEIFNDAKDIPANRDEEIEVHEDMSIDQLIQASEEVPKVVEEKIKESQVRSWM
jgi:hypothetical protein